MIRRLIILLLIVFIPKLVQAKQKNHPFINSISFYKGTPKGLSGTLEESSYNDDNISLNINIQTEKKNKFINYFIEYNKFNHSGIPSKYETYLMGIGLQKNIDIFSNSFQKASLTQGLSLGYSDDKYKLNIEGMDIFQYSRNSNHFTFDDNYFLISAEIGFLYKYSILSMNVKYKYSITYETYGTTDIKDIEYGDDSFIYNAFLEDEKPISYSQIQLGFSYYLPNPVPAQP